MRYRLDVVAADVADVVKFAGGWLFDRAMAGWDVTVLVADRRGDPSDDRPLQILGAQALDLDDALAAMESGVATRPNPQAVAVAAEAARTGFGRLRSFLEDGDDATWPADMYGDQHHMGTTRMHRDPSLGVVNEDCRVHGVANLYVAGSSVFPTAGAANPTLTITALALRLADHLKEELR